MVSLGRYLSVCIAWLTAVMTLVAGTPHVHCQCPNGNIKPFCLSMFSSASGCCCDGSCCAQASAAACCCHRQGVADKAVGGAHAQSGRDHDGFRFAKPSCVKHLEQEKAVARTQSAAKDTLVFISYTSVSPVQPSLMPIVTQAASVCAVRLLAPPHDIITRYLHLLI